MMSPSASKFVEVVLSKWGTTGVICLLLAVATAAPDHDRNLLFPAGDIGKLRPNCRSTEWDVFCDDVENYPFTELQRRITPNSDKLLNFFGNDSIVDVGTRFNAPGERGLCQSKEAVIFPRMGENENGTLRFIINQEAYRQGIRVEICQNVGSSCSMTDSFPTNYKTECQQNYFYRPLLSLDSEGNVMRDQFKYPSSCKCVLKT